MTATTRDETNWWRVFLRPSWVLLTLFVVVFSYFAFTVLAPWQLGKDDKIVARNEQIKTAYEVDPVPAGEALDNDGAIKDGKEWTRVILSGHYLPDDEVLLRLRPVDSGPAYQSLVPFRTDAGRDILINRGWLPAGEANAVPDIPPAPKGETTVEGMVRKDEPVHENAPLEREGYQQVYSMNTEQISDITGTDLAADYVQLSADEPGVLHPIPIPQLDRGNHLSYGYQWIAFGIMAPLGLGYFLISEIRQRRRQAANDERQDAAALDDADSPAAPAHAPEGAAAASPVSATTATATTTPTRRKRARYGDAKPDHYAKLRKQRGERY